MEQRVSVITLGVRDVDESRAFYEALGWTPHSTDENMPTFNLQGMAFALYPRDALAEDAQVPAAGEGFRGVTLAYCVRTQDEVAPTLQRAADAGGRIVKPAQDASWGGHSGYFADPDGHLFEVAYNPHSPLGADGRFQWGGCAPEASD